MGSLVLFEKAFASVGWFIPPYAQMGFLSRVAGEILKRDTQFSQDDLQYTLEPLYDAQGLAAMVCSPS